MLKMNERDSFQSRRKGGKGMTAYGQPFDPVRINREPRTAGVLLVAKRAHDDRVVERAQPGRVQRLHVEDIDALHFPQNLEPFQAGGLFIVRRHGSGRGPGRLQIFFGFHLCAIGRKMSD